jgi:hypothetical protein
MILESDNKWLCYWLLYFSKLFFGILEFELRASHLLGRHCATWTTLQSFCSGYFGDTVSLSAQAAWITILLFYVSCCSWDDRFTLHTRLFFFCCVGVLQTFLLSWPRSLPISASCIAWNDRCVLPCPAIGWGGVLWSFYQVWPWTTILLISASQ